MRYIIVFVDVNVWWNN